MPVNWLKIWSGNSPVIAELGRLPKPSAVTLNKILDPIPLTSSLPVMRLANFHRTKSSFALWVMLLFLGVYVLAVPFHTLFEDGGCHDAQCTSHNDRSEPPAHDHKTCVLCALNTLSLDLPTLPFTLLLAIGVLFQIAVSFTEPIMRFPFTVPPARAPPTV